jgi:hypothetical protein
MECLGMAKIVDWAGLTVMILIRLRRLRLPPGGGRRSTIAKLAIHWIIAALVVIAAFAFHSGPVLVLGDKTVVVLDVDIQPLLDD